MIFFTPRRRDPLRSHNSIATFDFSGKIKVQIIMCIFCHKEYKGLQEIAFPESKLVITCPDLHQIHGSKYRFDQVLFKDCPRLEFIGCRIQKLRCTNCPKLQGIVGDYETIQCWKCPKLSEFSGPKIQKAHFWECDVEIPCRIGNALISEKSLSFEFDDTNEDPNFCLEPIVSQPDDFKRLTPYLMHPRDILIQQKEIRVQFLHFFIAPGKTTFDRIITLKSKNKHFTRLDLWMAIGRIYIRNYAKYGKVGRADTGEGDVATLHALEFDPDINAYAIIQC